MARRRRNKPPVSKAPKPAAERDHMARVRASDQTWADFRAAAGPEPLNVLLGELVQRHVDRARSRQLRGGRLDDAELLDALNRAHELQVDVAAIVSRLEQRLGHRSAPDSQPGAGAEEHIGLDVSDSR